MYFSTYNYVHSAWLLEIFSCARREWLAQELCSRFGEQQCDKSDPPIIIAFGTREYSLYLWRLFQNRYLRSLRQSYTAKFPSAAILICVFLCYLRISDTRITIWKLSLINILWAKFWAFATNVSQNIKRVRNCTFSIVIRCKTHDDSIKLIVPLILNLSRVVLDVPLAICLTS